MTSPCDSSPVTQEQNFPHWKLQAVFCWLLEEAKLGGSWRWALGGPLGLGSPEWGLQRRRVSGRWVLAAPRGTEHVLGREAWVLGGPVGLPARGSVLFLLDSLRWTGTGTTVCRRPCKQLSQQLGCSVCVTSTPEWGARSGVAVNTVPPAAGV